MISGYIDDQQHMCDIMSIQLMLSASAGNPPPQEENVVSAGFLKSAFPKAVRLLNDADIVLRRKALLTISVMLPSSLQFERALALDAFVRVSSVLVLRCVLPHPFICVGTLDKRFVVRPVD